MITMMIPIFNKTIMSLGKMLQKIKEEMCPTKVIATHKMTDQQKKLWRAYTALLKKARVIKDTADTSKKKFWNKVEGDIDDFDHQLRIDEDNWTIEVHEDDCDNCDQDSK